MELYFNYFVIWIWLVKFCFRFETKLGRAAPSIPVSERDYWHCAKAHQEREFGERDETVRKGYWPLTKTPAHLHCRLRFLIELVLFKPPSNSKNNNKNMKMFSLLLIILFLILLSSILKLFFLDFYIYK